jgi:hypothetical protein
MEAVGLVAADQPTTSLGQGTAWARTFGNNE